MSGRSKLLVGIAALAALAVAVGAAGAIGVSRALDGDASQAVIEDAARQLGVEPDALSEALRQALENRVDEAVESGRLSDEQGERLKSRLESGVLPLFGGHGLPDRGHGHGLGHVRGAGLDAAADYLGLDEDALRERLRDGETLAEVARDEGKSVDGLVDALVRTARERIDEAVEEGRLDEDRAAELRAGLAERMSELVEGELRFGGHGPWLGRGHGFRGGPPPFAGSRG